MSPDSMSTLPPHNICNPPINQWLQLGPLAGHQAGIKPRVVREDDHNNTPCNPNAVIIIAEGRGIGLAVHQPQFRPRYEALGKLRYASPTSSVRLPARQHRSRRDGGFGHAIASYMRTSREKRPQANCGQHNNGYRPLYTYSPFNTPPFLIYIIL